MKRFLFTTSLLLMTPLFFLSARTASADFYLIKININKLDLFPDLPTQGSGGQQPGGQQPNMQPQPYGGMKGKRPMPMRPMPMQPMPMQPMPMQPNGAQPPAVVEEDPNPKWISSFVEIKNHNQKPVASTPLFIVTTIDHPWGKNNWRVFSSLYPYYQPKPEPIRQPSAEAEFKFKFTKEMKEKEKTTKGFLHLARWTLQRGLIKDFHKTMAEAVKVDPKDAIVKNYLRVKKALDSPFASDDPVQAELISEWRGSNYKPYDSDRKHYRIYAQVNASDTNTPILVKRRLDLMEDTLENFYYWFAVQEESSRQPNLPRFRLNSLLAGSKGDFTDRHLRWGLMPLTGDAFTPRRENVIVMSPQSNMYDTHYNEFQVMLDKQLDDANRKFRDMGSHVKLTRSELLNGHLSDLKKSPGSFQAARVIAAAQTAVILAKALEEQGERYTITNATVRQLLIASDMFPRNVQTPDWIVEGLAALFETPQGALYPTIGDKSWSHLISFKYFQKKNKTFAKPGDVMLSVVTDTYFQDARLLSKEARERTDDPDAQKSAKEAWEMGRSTSWAFMFYLAQNRKLDYVFNFGKELDKLPRDMDLSDQVLQGTFAKAFEMTDRDDARLIDSSKLQNSATSWFDLMSTTNLEHITIQSYYLEERARQDGVEDKKPAPTDPDPSPMTPTNPMSTMPPSDNLTGTSWGGKETLQTFGPVLFKFDAGGQVTLTDKNGPSQGKYQQSGNNITIQFPAKVYTGTINGKKMQGNATNGQFNWSWHATSGAAATQGLNPAPRMPNNPRPPNPGVRPIRPGGRR